MTDLPQEGKRVAIIGKGGSSKSTTGAHLIAYWAKKGIPVVGMDSDDPGEEEHGSLYAWAEACDLGAPVYPAPAAPRIAEEARRLTPENGLLLLDTGAWERKAGNRHFAVLSAVELAVLALQPTPIELERAGSVLAAIEQMESFGVAVPRLMLLMTMVNRSASAARDTRKDLVKAGFELLKTEIPRSDGREGYAQAFGLPPRVRNTDDDDPMALLGEELLREVQK